MAERDFGFVTEDHRRVASALHVSPIIYSSRTEGRRREAIAYAVNSSIAVPPIRTRYGQLPEMEPAQAETAVDELIAADIVFDGRLGDRDSRDTRRIRIRPDTGILLVDTDLVTWKAYSAGGILSDLEGTERRRQGRERDGFYGDDWREFIEALRI